MVWRAVRYQPRIEDLAVLWWLFEVLEEEEGASEEREREEAGGPVT
jgi:hypothetical protein